MLQFLTMPHLADGALVSASAVRDVTDTTDVPDLRGAANSSNAMTGFPACGIVEQVVVNVCPKSKRARLRVQMCSYPHASLSEPLRDGL